MLYATRTRPLELDHQCIEQSNLGGLTEPARCPAVTKFAKVIGEIHSLSRADLHLIALAHTLHLAQHGQHSLRDEPVPARAVGKGKKNAASLPGWGDSGGTWEDLDRMDEAEKAALEKAQGGWHFIVNVGPHGETTGNGVLSAALELFCSAIDLSTHGTANYVRLLPLSPFYVCR